MSKVRIQHTQSFKEYSSPYQDVHSLLSLLGLEHLFLWDGNFWYVSHEDWGKIFADVLLNMPKYVSDKFDCEDFALLVSARVLERHRLNTCGVAVGNCSFGYHGFNIFLSELGLFYLEPQTGEVWSVSENSGYKAEIVILG